MRRMVKEELLRFRRHTVVSLSEKPTRGQYTLSDMEARIVTNR